MIKNLNAVAQKLEEEVRNFTDIAVVGISGGVDSSLVSAICVEALGAENVFLVSMPCDKADKETFNARSSRLADKLGARHLIFDIGTSYNAFLKEFKSILPDNDLQLLTKANMRPRIRMNVLYSLAGELGYTSKKRIRVMGTGHLSEDLIGYDTKGGDALADIFILAELVKSEVYQLGEFYNLPEEILTAPPSAGLYPGQTDKEELGFSYDELEESTLAVFTLIKSGLEPQELSLNHPDLKNLNPETLEFVIKRYQANHHKHEAPAVVGLRCKEWFG